MKRLKIRVQGIKRPPYKIKISPYTTPGDVLAYLQLDTDYFLYPVTDPPTCFSPYFTDEPMYSRVTDGQRLIARTCWQAQDLYLEQKCKEWPSAAKAQSELWGMVVDSRISAEQARWHYQKFIDEQPPPVELSPEEALELQKRVEEADAFMEHIAFGKGEI